MIINPPNISWLEEKIPTEIYTYLLSQIAIAKDDYKHQLAGHISRSLQLPDEKKIFTNYLLEKAKELNWDPLTGNVNLLVNFQKKYEYNPAHVHSGKLSFVLWIKIPYKYEDEQKTAIAKGISSNCMNGAFEITYINLLGCLTGYTYSLDPSMEGYMVMFPSETQHCVYPFYTSDDVRISISGNLT